MDEPDVDTEEDNHVRILESHRVELDVTRDQTSCLCPHNQHLYNGQK
jgi:hypothetical protein